MEEIYIIGIWNVIVFFIYGLDKLFAKLDMWRISEKMLLSCSLVLGGVGAFFGMKIWRHKTKHKSFKIVAGISFIITIVVAAYIK